MSNSRSSPFSLLAWLVLTGPAVAQSLRDEVRSLLGAARFPSYLAALADLSTESTLALGRLRVDGDVADTSIRLLNVPWQRTFELGDAGSPGLHVEGSLGYLDSRVDIPDIWLGGLPGHETRVTSRTSALSALGAIGLEFAPTDELTIVPMLTGGIAYLDDDTLYRGLGATTTEGVFDRLLFNWSSTLAMFGGALEVRHAAPLGATLRSETQARYDLRRVEGIHSTDPVQDVSDTIQRATLRLDVIGPTGWDLADEPIDWRGTLGYAHFLGDSDELLGFTQFVELGIGIEARLPDAVSVASGLTLRASVLFGDDVIGWSAGLGVSF